MELLIKNAALFDPKNGIKGDKTDICIKDGKVVARLAAAQRSLMQAAGL